MKRLCLVLGLVVGCSSAGATDDGEPAGPGGSAGTSATTGGQGGGGQGGEGGAAGGLLGGSGGAGGSGAGGAAGSVPVGGSGGGATVGQCADDQSEQEVYGHSATVLYRVDAATKKVTKVGDLTCGGFFPESVIDLAINKEGVIYGTTASSLVKIDKKTAACAVVNSAGSYPNSLSFVPAGTIYPDKEALVGYQGSTYVVIDPQSGAITSKGSLSGGYTSSGDIVSVINGGTFLTVKGNGCNDCLVQVDPASGSIVKMLGDVGYGAVFGLAFWANEVYGFTDGGEMFTFDLATNQAKSVAIPDAPSGLSFYGAGSSTCARLDPIIID